MDQSLKSIVTRSKTQKINTTDANIKLEKNQQSKKKKKSSNIKNNLEISIKQSPKEELFKANKKKIDESIKRKGSRRKHKLTEKMEISNEFITQDLNTNSNESIVKLGLKNIIKDKNSSDQIKKSTKSNNSLLNNSRALEKNKTPNKKLKWKIVLTGVKISPSMITPKSTPPKLSLTPHRSKKTPKKSPISLGSPKTHTKSVPRLLKSPRKLSLSTIPGVETTDKSKTRKKKLKRTQKESLKESSVSEKDLSISSVEKTKHKKSSINLKPKVRRFSKQPKSQKSEKLKSPSKLKSSSYVEKDSSKMSIATPNSTLDSDSINISSLKNKTSSIKHRLLNSKVMKLMTRSQIKDVLAEPIVLLKKLSPEDISSILTNSRSKSNISFEVKSSIKLNIKSVNRDSDSELKHNHTKKSKNKMSSKIKDNTLIQKEKESIISSTPREEKMSLMDMNLICDTPMLNTSHSSRSSRSHSRTRLSDIMDKSTIISNISPSLMNKSISDANQSYFSNDMTQQMSCNENATTKLIKKQENKKNSTYELEKPQTLKLQQMIRKRTSTDANLITPTMDNKKSKVHFMNECDTNSKSINWSASRSNISHNNIQRNSMNSSYKLKQIETPKYHQNSSTPTLKTKSTSLKNKFIPIARSNMNQNTPKTFESISKKSEKKSSVKKKPNFAKIHEKMFARSESLVDARKRLEDRHIAFSVNKTVPKVEEERKKNVKKEENKPLPTDTTNDGTHNRFGFRLRKNEAIKIMSTKQPAFSRSKQQKEMTQMTLKGIRMNRRFELQMKFRNINT